MLKKTLMATAVITSLAGCAGHEVLVVLLTLV